MSFVNSCWKIYLQRKQQHETLRQKWTSSIQGQVRLGQRKQAAKWEVEKTFERPLDCKEIKPVNPKGNQSWVLIERNDAEAPILWPPDEKSQLIGKDPDAGQDWRQEEKGMTEDEIVRWHHWLDGHKFEQAPGDGEGQGSLACSPRGHKELDTTE